MTNAADDPPAARCFRIAAAWFCLAAGLAGCGGTRVTQENCDKITAGMSREDVEKILGPAAQSYQGILTWRGDQPEQRITIVFDEERKVSEISCEGLSKP